MIETIISVFLGIFAFMIVMDILIDMANREAIVSMWLFVGGIILLIVMVL